MKKIPVGRGLFALVDDCDYPELSKRKWYALKHRTGKFYAISFVERKGVLMHRQILGVTDTKIKVDHENGNSLDNQRSNIRACTNSENMMNRGATANNKTGFKGVLKRGGRRTKQYKAQICVRGKIIYIGCFDTAKEAAHAYNEKAKELHGEFARLNAVE